MRQLIIFFIFGYLKATINYLEEYINKLRNVEKRSTNFYDLYFLLLNVDQGNNL